MGTLTLKDFGEKATPGLESDRYAAPGYGMESQADADQSNQVYNQYFSPLTSKYGITPAQLTQLFQSNAIPAAQQQQMMSGEQDYFNNVVHPDTWYDKLLGQLALATNVGVATAGIGDAIGPALGGALGSTAGGIATGALSGTAGGALGAALQGKNIGTGALEGGVSGGLGAAASPLISSLASDGLNPTLAAGLVKGGIGAGVGALGADLTGGNVGNSALTGGLGGFASGAVGDLTGSNALGAGAGTIAGTLANKYLTAPATAAAPVPVAAPATPTAPTPAAAPPASAQSTQMPNEMPVVQVPTPPSGSAPANIGAYSGFNSTGLGYQPMSQIDPNIQNYNTYGQGPEARFFAPTPGT